jgi:hypothetical protein
MAELLSISHMNAYVHGDEVQQKIIHENSEITHHWSNQKFDQCDCFFVTVFMRSKLELIALRHLLSIIAIILLTSRQLSDGRFNELVAKRRITASHSVRMTISLPAISYSLISTAKAYSLLTLRGGQADTAQKDTIYPPGSLPPWAERLLVFRNMTEDQRRDKLRELYAEEGIDFSEGVTLFTKLFPINAFLKLSLPRPSSQIT